MCDIVIIELLPFSKKAAKILDKRELEALHNHLIQHPNQGDVIPDTGGVRKLRWAAGGKGKRGGARVLCFYHVVGTTIYLMACYTKNEQSDVRTAVKKQLKSIVEQIKKGK